MSSMSNATSSLTESMWATTLMTSSVPSFTGDEIETPGPQGKALGDIETGRDHDTGDQLELAVLGHVVTNGWSVPIY